MRRLLAVVLMLAMVLGGFTVSEACATGGCEAVVITQVVYVVVGGGGGNSVAFPTPLFAMQAAFLVAISPWLIMYNQNPDCRQEPTMGEMAQCVQRKGGNK